MADNENASSAPLNNQEMTEDDCKKDEFLNPNLLTFDKPLKISDSEDRIAAKVKVSTAPKEKDKNFAKSPAQAMAEKMVPIPYKEPPWSGLPKQKYSLDVLKGGIIIDNIPFDKPFLTIGRFTHCDINMQHPTVSRFHCIIQYRAESSESERSGMYVYDLESTHGTYQNKYRLKPLVYNPLRVGHIIQFGKSTRMFILQGPSDDQEMESQYTVTELRELAKEKKRKREMAEKLDDADNDGSDSTPEPKELKAPSCSNTSDGIDWGMGDDAVDEESVVNPFATNEDLYLEDPKKTLRGWFEREGYDLPNYDVTDISPGQFRCKLELPLPDMGSASLTCAIEHKGKKKEAVAQCALEACRLLDSRGLLRQATHESHKRTKKNWSENDYYASDEDEFLDRTGDIEHKRRMRKRHSDSTVKGHIDTYESLNQEYTKVTQEIERLETLIAKANRVLHRQEGSDEDVDDYVRCLSSSATTDKKKILDWKVELNKLRKEEERVRLLVNVARPLGVDELVAKDVEKPVKESKIECQNRNKVGTLTKKNELPSKAGFKNKLQNVSALNKAKGFSSSSVHHTFFEEDEPQKMKLTKVDFNDDSSPLKPIPYDKSHRRPHKYSEMLRREKEKEKAIENSASKVTARDSVETPIEANPADSIAREDEESSMETNEADSQSPDGQEGPSLPPEPKSFESVDDFRKPAINLKGKTIKRKKKEKIDPFSFENSYETWVPPVGQTGDGRTSLNEKLGY